MQMSPFVGRTWALRGQTPVLYQRGRSHEKVTVIGAICAKPGQRRKLPKLYFRLLPGRNANAIACAAFLRQLASNVRGPLFLIWDQLRAHKSVAVQRILKRYPRISVYHFPSYSPNLNPIEYGWAHLKCKELVNHAPTQEAELLQSTKHGI